MCEAERKCGGAGRRGELLRVCTYNLLADNYANTPFAREKLYHYCPGRYLNVDFRSVPARGLRKGVREVCGEKERGQPMQ